MRRHTPHIRMATGAGHDLSDDLTRQAMLLEGRSAQPEYLEAVPSARGTPPRSISASRNGCLRSKAGIPPTWESTRMWDASLEKAKQLLRPRSIWLQVPSFPRARPRMCRREFWVAALNLIEAHSHICPNAPGTALVLGSRSGVGDGSQLIAPTRTSRRRTKAPTEWQRLRTHSPSSGASRRPTAIGYGSLFA